MPQQEKKLSFPNKERSRVSRSPIIGEPETGIFYYKLNLSEKDLIDLEDPLSRELSGLRRFPYCCWKLPLLDWLVLLILDLDRDGISGGESLGLHVPDERVT